jgi:L-amino acid N-acyltransferase YncA
MPYFEKIGQLVRSIGPGNACLYLIDRIFGGVSSGRLRVFKYYITAQATSGKATERAMRNLSRGPFTLRWVSTHCAEFTQVERPASVIAARFAQGARCVVAAHRDGRFAGFLWLVVGPYEEDEVRARFIPQPTGRVAWDFDVAVAPSFRLGRVFGYLWDAANEEMRNCGVDVSVSRISAFNAASISAHRRAGAEIVGSAIFVCAGPLQIASCTLGPRLHVSLGPRHRPEITVRVPLEEAGTGRTDRASGDD